MGRDLSLHAMHYTFKSGDFIYLYIYNHRGGRYGRWIRGVPEGYRPAVADICEEPKTYWLEVSDGIASLGIGHIFGKNRLFSGIKYNQYYSDDFKAIHVIVPFIRSHNEHFDHLRKSGDISEVVLHQAGTII